MITLNKRKGDTALCVEVIYKGSGDEIWDLMLDF